MGGIKRRASGHMDIRDARQGQKQSPGTTGVEVVPPADRQHGAPAEVRAQASPLLRHQPRLQDYYN